MKKFLPLLFMLFSFNIQAQMEVACTDITPKITVQGHQIQPQIIHNLSIKEIGDHMEVQPDIKNQKSFHVGLTIAQWMPNYGYNMNIGHQKNGTYCAVPDLDIDLKFESLLVLIAKEVTINSCSYKEILKHEMKHVDAYNNHINIAATQIKVKIFNLLNKKIFRAQSIDIITLEIDKFFKDNLTDIVLSSLTEVDTIHSDIDSIDEYEEASHMCNGEMQNLFHSLK